MLSDAALLLRGPDGTVTPVLDDRLARLPRAALATEALVDAHLRNKEGGFFTAAADPAVAARAVTGVLPRHQVRALAALTDGATRWTEMFRAGDWTALFDLVAKGGRPVAGGAGTGAGGGGPGGAGLPGAEQDARRRDGGVRGAVRGRAGRWRAGGGHFAMTPFSSCSSRASSATSRRSQWASWRT